ncbi:PAS domain-containing protein [Sulfurimonas sp.]
MKNKLEDNHYLKQELYKLIQTDIKYFEFILNYSLDGMWYWDLEKPENEWMNPRFWETLGYNPKEMKHLTSEWKDIIFEDDLKVATENFYKHIEDERNPYDQIVRYKHKNGSTVCIRCRGIAVRDENGKPIRMLGSHNDLTDVMTLQHDIMEEDSIKVLNEKLLKRDTEIRVFDHVYYNTKSKIVKHEDTIIKLTDQEISLFELFIKNKNTLLTFSKIEYLINPNKFLTNNAVALIISRLRKKIPMINIKTVYGQGYMLMAD